MKPNAAPLKVSESKPGPKPDSKNDLKSLPMAELLKNDWAHLRTVSVKPKHRSDWRNMVRTRSRKRRLTRF